MDRALEDAELSIAGSYAGEITGTTNSCAFREWGTNSGPEVTFVIGQRGEAITATVTGERGAYLKAVAGTSTFEGEARGSSIDLRLTATTRAADGPCSFRLNARLQAEFSGESTHGRFVYVPAEAQGCPDIAECVVSQEFQAERVATARAQVEPG